jgi:hypothetical protein
MPFTPALLFAAVTSVRLVSAHAAGPDPAPFAITSVTVLTMTSDRPIRNATVVVRDGRISAVGPAGSTPVPADARRIDGRGMFLMPGLVDMHAHLFADEYAPESAATAELGLYLALGTTSARLRSAGRNISSSARACAREPWSGPAFGCRRRSCRATRARIRCWCGTPPRPAPRCGPPTCPGYDFIKLTTNITPEVYDAVMAESRATGMRVTGHVDPRVGAPRAIAAGQQIEHLDNYMETVLADSAPTRKSVSDVGAYRAANWNSLAYVDMQKLEALAGATARAGLYVTPTIGSSPPGSRPSTPTPRCRRAPTILPAGGDEGPVGAITDLLLEEPAHCRAARAVHRDQEPHGARDRRFGRPGDGGFGRPGGLMSYGWMMHRELQAFVAAGLTPYQALRAATVVPATWLGVSAELGTIEVGKRADLLLLVRQSPHEHRQHHVDRRGVGGWQLVRHRAIAEMKEAARVAINAPLPPSRPARQTPR